MAALRKRMGIKGQFLVVFFSLFLCENVEPEEEEKEVEVPDEVREIPLPLTETVEDKVCALMIQEISHPRI